MMWSGPGQGGVVFDGLGLVGWTLIVSLSLAGHAWCGETHGEAPAAASVATSYSLPRTVLISGLGPLQAEFGDSVAGAGDIDGDGSHDLVVSAPGADNGAIHGGALLVYSGGPAGVGPAPSSVVYGDGGAGLGDALYSAGDVNADGYADVVVGTYYLDERAYVLTGGPSGLATDPPIELNGPGRGSYFGSEVAGGGDFNGDGFDDVLVSADGTDDGGVLQVHYGGASGTDPDPSQEYGNPWSTRSTWFPSDFSGAGDVNGDGLADIAVGYSAYDDGNGWVAVFLGDPAGTSETADWVVTGEARQVYLGWRVSADADFDADGYADVIVRAGGGGTHGTMRVYSGASTGPATAATAVLLPSAGANQFATGGLSASGDIDGDGFDDFALSVEYSPEDAVVEVYFGAASGLAETPELTLSSPYPFTESMLEFGWGVDIAPDLDGDGFDEVVVGTPNYAVGNGRVDIYSGHPRDQDDDGWDASVDCDDAAADVHPGATEVCDGIDQDCDGAVDNHADGASPWYADADGDGFGSARAPTRACEAPLGYVADATDCNDLVADIHPGAAERCDPADLDQDCDGLADDADPEVDAATQATWYIDADDDGYGDASLATRACDAPSGAVADATDCDDSRADVHPGAAEVCDASDTDEDCDGLADDADRGVAPGTLATWYPDGDADGYGDPASPVAACDAPDGTTARPGDCDDARADVHPGGVEVCDVADHDGAPTDEDCDGLADDADLSVDRATQSTWYADADADGHGDPGAPLRACSAPASTTPTGDDCDDNAPAVHPGAIEQCGNGADDDCDPATTDACPDTAPDTATDTGGDTAPDSANPADSADSADSPSETGDKQGDGCGCDVSRAGGRGSALSAALALFLWCRHRARQALGPR